MAKTKKNRVKIVNQMKIFFPTLFFLLKLNKISF